MDRMPLHRRLAFRLTALVTLLGVSTIAVIGVLTYQRSRADLEHWFGVALQRVVATAALELDGDAHRGIRDLEDATGEDFARLQAQLRRVQEANGLRQDLLYTLHLNDGEVATAAVMLQQTPYTGEPYTVPEANRAAIRRTVREKTATHSALYEDEHGAWISAFAPILDSQGEVAGVLEADYELARFRAALREQFLSILATSSVALLLAILGSLVFGRRLETALFRIREGAAAIEQEHYGHRIELGTEDELGLVARQFNRMAEVLSERFQMLKFLPRHTLDAVRSRAEGQDAPEAERVDAAIFFSDIRGYTAMSEGLADERVVAMLNVYLRRQAELLQAHGGTIDKFIGDAVLAVFRGPDRCADAVRAALEIQREVEAMNARGAFERPVTVGIGIAAGSLVFAEIGSEERRERTLIGSVVNLAARLCSHAGEGEVVVSGPLAEALGARLWISRSEQVELKGFAGEQACHGVAGIDGPPT